MPAPKILEQFGESTIGTYQAGPEDEISAMKLKLADFDSNQKTKKFSLYQEGIEQQIYNGQIDEIRGRQMMIDEATKIGLDELDIAKLKTQAAQAAYSGRSGGGGGGGKIDSYSDSDLEKMLEEEIDNILSGQYPLSEDVRNNLNAYFYKHPIFGKLKRSKIDSIIKGRKGGNETDGLLSQLGF